MLQPERIIGDQKGCGDHAWVLGPASVRHSREVAVSPVFPYSVLSSSACTSLRVTGGPEDSLSEEWDLRV